MYREVNHKEYRCTNKYVYTMLDKMYNKQFKP